MRKLQDDLAYLPRAMKTERAAAVYAPAAVSLVTPRLRRRIEPAATRKCVDIVARAKTVRITLGGALAVATISGAFG